MKTDTAAWLTGIRDAGTWGEKFLLRDLQLAAQNCVEMSQNGVEVKVTEDLAHRLIDALMAAEGVRPVTSMSGFIQGLPDGPLTAAIAAQLPDLPPRGSLRHAVPALIVPKFLPSGVTNPRLVETFKAAMESQDVEIAWKGAYLYLLHGPPTGRAEGVAALRKVAGQANRIMTSIEAEKIFALGDDTVAKSNFRCAENGRPLWEMNFGSKSVLPVISFWTCSFGMSAREF